MSGWLITAEALQSVRSAQSVGVVPTTEQQAEFTASYESGDYPGARIMTKAGGVAYISIKGVLTKEPSWVMRYFGGGNTAYSEIISALNEAERDPNIESIVLDIDSPGGQTNGLTTAMDAIADTTKPTTAEVSGMAASAAYGLASQADSITALDRGAVFGSIGVKGSYYVDENIVDITSSNAPEKAPDVTTEDGKSQVRKYLDQIEAVFIQDIAEGRKTSPENVKANFGRGGVFLAQDALTHGMIDELKDKRDREPTSGAATNTPKSEAKMNLQELQAKHPETYAAAVQQGVAQERDRVSAHLTLGEASGDMKTALAAVEKGDTLTAAYQAKYMAAGFKNGQIGARQTDDNTTDDALGNVTPGAKTTDTTADDKAFLDALGVVHEPN